MRARGDRVVDLGSLGSIVCRPGFRALEAIEEQSDSKSLTDVANQLARKAGLRIVTTILYETHLDFAASEKAAPRYSREAIGSAVLEVGVGRLQEHAFRLVLSAFAPSEENDPGNEQRAEAPAPPASPPPNTPLLP